MILDLSSIDLSEIGKLSETLSIRIPEKLKEGIDRLDKNDRKGLNKAAIIAISYYLHMKSFKPILYLKDD